MSISQQHPVVSRHEAAQGSLKSYVMGFLTSLYLTLTAYFVTVKHLLSGWALIGMLMGLAVIQLLVQLIFFLHLGRESKPRWNVQVLLFAVMVVGIVVGGSLWIMSNLNYHMMSPGTTDQFIQKDEGITK